ncbi:MAG: thiamine pyrophosphate-dependent enzyme, partial [Gemmatimonadales bacterium]
RAVRRARERSHPTLLEVRTYRFMGHSMSDPLHGVYRTKDELEEHKKRDPITSFAHKLVEDGALDQARLDAMDAEARRVADQAAQFADQSPDPQPDELYTDVYAE